MFPNILTEAVEMNIRFAHHALEKIGKWSYTKQGGKVMDAGLFIGLLLMILVVLGTH